MSCFVLNPYHFSYLAETALLWRLSYWSGKAWKKVRDPKDAERVAELLWDQNVISAAGGPDGDRESVPGFIREGRERFEVSFVAFRDPVHVLKAIGTYVSQAESHREDWEESEARWFVRSLRSEAIQRLPGYKSAPREQFTPKERSRLVPLT